MNNRDSKEQTLYSSGVVSHLIDMEEFILPDDDEDDFIDISVEEESVRNSRCRLDTKFIMGPIDFEWMQHAIECEGKAPLIGLLIWFKKGLTGSSVVTLSHELLSQFGIGRHAARRCYDRMEDKGLIIQNKRGNKVPELTHLPQLEYRSERFMIDSRR